MTNNAPDYAENLAFPPQGDWSDTQPKNNTDRTASTIELVEKIEKLSKQLGIAKDFIRFIVRYDCKVVVPKDFSKYEACWFFIRSLAQEKLEQIEELEK